ncbi:MAG: DUF72 domain-containing protein [Acidimicrobiales bacterium]
MAVIIGTSGWQYKHWRGGFYPPGLPARSWLDHYVRGFATVELNNSFYRLPETSSFARWADAVPADFVMAVKASRYLSHVRRLRDPEEPVGRLLERAGELGVKLGPILLQLPPDMALEVDRLARTLSAFPPHVRVALEPRHPSWWVPETRRALEAAGAALCLTDARGPRTPMWRTTDWGYVRFHQGRAQPAPCYGRRALQSWAERLATRWDGDADIYAYFNNDATGCAPRDARRFALAVRSVGLSPTRVPAPAQTPVG